MAALTSLVETGTLLVFGGDGAVRRSIRDATPIRNNGAFKSVCNAESTAGSLAGWRVLTEKEKSQSKGCDENEWDDEGYSPTHVFLRPRLCTRESKMAGMTKLDK